MKGKGRERGGGGGVVHPASRAYMVPSMPLGHSCAKMTTPGIHIHCPGESTGIHSDPRRHATLHRATFARSIRRARWHATNNAPGGTRRTTRHVARDTAAAALVPSMSNATRHAACNMQRHSGSAICNHGSTRHPRGRNALSCSRTPKRPARHRTEGEMRQACSRRHERRDVQRSAGDMKHETCRRAAGDPRCVRSLVRSVDRISAQSLPSQRGAARMRMRMPLTRCGCSIGRCMLRSAAKASTHRSAAATPTSPAQRHGRKSPTWTRSRNPLAPLSPSAPQPPTLNPTP